MIGAVPYFLVCVVLVSIIVSSAVALCALEVAKKIGLSTFGAAIMGAALCFVLAYVFFLLIDPDPVSEFADPIPLYSRTLSVTGFSAMFWLPLFLVFHGKFFRKEGG